MRDWIYINKLKWFVLFRNPNAIELLKQNQDKINWKYFSENSNIYNHKNIKKWKDLRFSENVENL